MFNEEQNKYYLARLRKTIVILRSDLLTGMAEDKDCRTEHEGGQEEEKADTVDGHSSTSEHGRQGANTHGLAPDANKLIPHR